MPAQAITAAFAKNVKAPRRDRERQVSYIDTLERGLALVMVVSYGGSRTFRVMTYRNGKPQTYKLGTYPQMSVKEARAQARAYWQNPQRFEAQAETGSFKEIADKWLKRHVEGNKLISQPEIERILAQYVFPKWKDRPFLEIRRREVNDLLDHVADHHGRSQADATLAVIRGIMNWHQTRDEDYSSPIVRGMKRNGSKKGGERTLSDEEIRALWTAAGECGLFGALVKLLLLTAQRREKVSTMQWEHVVDGAWTVPHEEREKGTGGVLMLPQVALDLIEAQPRFANNPHVFAGSARGRRHGARSGPPAFNSWSQRKAELDKKLAQLCPGMQAWKLHDLRRTARSLMARADVRPDVAERVLGHAIPGVEGVYNKHQYVEQKADALQRVAALVGSILSPAEGNVVRMPKARR
jgi:integrase